MSAEVTVHPGRLPALGDVAKNFTAVVADPKTVFGIKLGLAGLLAVYLSQLIRLGHANWAVFTVLVLAPAQYVGAISPRSVARVAGTIIGGFVGIWLVGNFEQDRLFFLVFAFVYIFVCMYMYGGSIFPYAFFLCANTLVTISANGIFDPANAWPIGLARTLEILTGVVSVIVVANLVWPRFARREFIDLARAALGDVAKLVDLQHQSLATGADLWEKASSIAIALREQSSRLRALLQNGANESLYFRRRLPSYTMAVVSLTHLLQASLDLFRRQKGEPRYLEDVGTELFTIHESIGRELQMLADSPGSGAVIKEDRLESAFHALEERLQEVLATRTARNYSLEDVLDLANHQAALWIIRDELLKLRALLAGLPLPGDPPRRDKPREFRLARIDMSRVRDAVKPAIAATGALLICDWFNPPGAVGIPLGVLNLSYLSKNFVGGKGDRGSLQGAFKVSVAGLLFVILVFLISPALSNYSAMNLFLFAELFAFGYYSASVRGQNLHQSAALFFIAATVNLDAEKPVAVQTVFGSYFSVALAIFIAAIVGRLFWPVLPETELRKRFIEFFSICSNFLAKTPGHGDEALSDRLTLIPIEAVSWVRGLKGRHCPESEVEKILALTMTMRRLALYLSSRARAQLPALPESIARLVDPSLQKAREEFRTIAEALTSVFREGTTRVAVPSTKAARESFQNTLQEVRRQDLLADQSLESVRSFLSLAHRLDVIADDLEMCRDQALALTIERYWGDYSL
ncbi:MAG TPA: FUSC family protein [Chthoniobacterales bacterium]|nr:FUSC family protein [Chthoniobacterales bacterium]